MNPATLQLIVKLIPAIVEGITEGADIIKRLTAGDTTAAQQAVDWLGVTTKFQAAVDEWHDEQRRAASPPV
jgi:hypothetical protein